MKDLFLEKVVNFEEERKSLEERLLKLEEKSLKEKDVPDKYLDTGTGDKSRGVPEKDSSLSMEDLWHVACSTFPKLIQSPAPDLSSLGRTPGPDLSLLGRTPDWKTLSETFQMLLFIMSRTPEKQKIQSGHAGECTKKNCEITAA